MTRRGFAVHWNGPAARCIGRPHSRCIEFWAAVKRWHTGRPPNGNGWSDIAYSFGACPHGEVLVGRGWHLGQFANGAPKKDPSLGGDSHWYTVLGFIGEGEEPTWEMLAAITDLITEGRASGRCGLEVRPHLDFAHKPCPGPTLTAKARAWHLTPFTPDEEDTMAVVTVIGQDRQRRWWSFKNTTAVGVELTQAEADFWFMVDPSMYTDDPDLIERLKRGNGLIPLTGGVVRA